MSAHDCQTKLLLITGLDDIVNTDEVCGDELLVLCDAVRYQVISYIRH